jgi:hypothetical protein
MSAQTGWRWCDKCQGMFFSENPSHGVCAADNHPRDDHASGHYVIQFGDAVAGAQGHWFDPKVPQESPDPLARYNSPGLASSKYSSAWTGFWTVIFASEAAQVSRERLICGNRN